MLISHGHRWPALLDYTVPQARLFAKAAAERDRELLWHNAVAARVSQAEVSDWRSFRRDLLGD